MKSPKKRVPKWKRVLIENEEEAFGLLFGVLCVSLVLVTLDE